MPESNSTSGPAPLQPIIIKKVKGGHGGHHGGAWKVAYADFVTAMMALFIVLWLMNSSKEVQQAVGGYFRDPSGKGKQMGSGQGGTGDGLLLSKDNMPRLKEELEKGTLKVIPIEEGNIIFFTDIIYHSEKSLSPPSQAFLKMVNELKGELVLPSAMATS